MMASDAWGTRDYAEWLIDLKRSDCGGRRSPCTDPQDDKASFLPQRLERAAPGEDLVEHRVDRLLVAQVRLEGGEVLKVGEEGEHDLVAHGGDLDLRHHQPQVLHRANPAGAAVADEAG